MPELPEVETVRTQLQRALPGKRFVVVERVEPAMLLDCTEDDVRGLLPGRQVVAVDRHGKFLVVGLDADLFLTLHLGMTGHLLVGDPIPGFPSPHSRFLFILESDKGSRLTLEFRDIRKFGRLHLTRRGPAARLQQLGPDAWKGEWDRAYLAATMKGRTAPLKAFLLDQRHLAGIGNIYADEILWWARLSPVRQAGSLSDEEVAVLADEIRRRLGEGVRLLGCSISDFVDTEGKPGGFQEWLRAYGKQGTACTRCGVVMVRVVVGGRGTVYCPGCQR